MKKILFSISMLMLSCTIMMGQTDPKAYAKELKQANKNVKEAIKQVTIANGDLNQAQKLVDEVIKYPEIASQPDVWNVAGTIKKKRFEAEQQKLYLKQSFDEALMYNSLYDAFELYFKCDEVEKNAVDKKGNPVKVQYHDVNAKFIADNRPWLINGGVKYFNAQEGDENVNKKTALKYFALYIESSSHPMLNIQNDTLVTQIAYYAALGGMHLKDYETTLKYAAIAKTDPQYSAKGYEFCAGAYREMKDTVKWIAELKDGVTKFPENTYFSNNLLDYYNTNNKFDEALEFAYSMAEKAPNDEFMQYVKGYLCHRLEKYDDAITAYKACLAIKPDYVDALSNLALVYCTQARDYQNALPTNISNAKYKEELEVIREYYLKAKPYYEKVRELIPEKRDKWLNGLHSVYYMLNMGEELKAIEALMEE